MAKHLHELVYTICTIESLVHQFIDRELLGEGPNMPAYRRRESGAKLQARARLPHTRQGFSIACARARARAAPTRHRSLGPAPTSLARLSPAQDTLETMQSAPLKPAVKASLLSGGIASLLYLFSILLRDLNATLAAVPQVPARPG